MLGQSFMQTKTRFDATPGEIHLARVQRNSYQHVPNRGHLCILLGVASTVSYR